MGLSPNVPSVNHESGVMRISASTPEVRSTLLKAKSEQTYKRTENKHSLERIQITIGIREEGINNIRRSDLTNSGRRSIVPRNNRSGPAHEEAQAEYTRMPNISALFSDSPIVI